MSTPSFLNVCRLCLVKDKVSIPIFEGEGEFRQIFMKIVTCLPVKVDKSDRLPKKICDVCLYNVENVFKFWHTTASSEKKLLQWLEDSEKQDDLSGNNSSTIETEQVILKEEAIEQEQVSEHSKSHENECSQDGLERSEVEDSNSDEEGFNSEDDAVNDDVGEKEVHRKDEAESEEDGYGELEPTTFVNVTLACEDQPGPSGLQTEQSLGQPKVTQVVLKTVPTLQTIKVQPVQQIQAAQPGQAEPEAVPSTSKTVPASSGLFVHWFPTVINADKAQIPRKQANGVLLFTSNENVKCQNYEENTNTEKTQLRHSDRSRKTKRLKLALLSPEERLLRKTCEICGKSFQNISHANAHRRIHTGEKPYLCDICGTFHISLSRLKTHYRTHSDNRPFKCDICSSTFKYRDQLKVHQKRHTEGKKFVCDVCGHACHAKAELVLHKKRHFKMYDIHCEVCNKGFYLETELRDHMVKHTGIKPYKCEFCDNSYVSKNSLTCHVKSRHNDHPMDLDCEVCHKKFAFPQSLRKHMQRHKGSGGAVCDVCGKVVTSSYMQVHLRTHTGERPIECKICGKTFRSANYLKTHLRVHTGEKPYTCEKCNKCFTQRSTLVVHMRSHTGEKPYVCVVCGKSYVTRTLLVYHQKNHELKE